MAKILTSPSKYVQGKNGLEELSEHVDSLGDDVFAICDPMILENYKDRISDGLAGKRLTLEEFHGECTENEIKRIQDKVENQSSDSILGIGGGKTLDTAKAVSHYSELPVGIVPTIASTDAPCSSLSVIYSEEGEFEKYLHLDTNPDLVLVDTELIARAPKQFLVSGMGDALATYFEAEACSRTRRENIAGGTQTAASLELARLSYDNLLEYGLRAKKAAETDAVTEALEKIVETNTLLSGIGFESGGLAAAHAIHNGLTALEETHKKSHGEKVAFSTLVQLVLENRKSDIVREVVSFCRDVGLPTDLSDLNLVQVDEYTIMEVAERSCAEDDTMRNMPFEVEPEMVKDAILATDNMFS